MKCKICGGTGHCNDVVMVDGGFATRVKHCAVCNGTGEIGQTEQEYMQTCNAEELGCFICEKFFHGACGECRFCEKTELRHHCILGEWLKQPHKGD